MKVFYLLNASTLKWIALITMVIDHVGLLFFPDLEILRWIGRISFPLFAFLLTEGYKHTSNIWKYFLRLGIFALIAEIPYDYCMYGKIFFFGKQNIFFDLLLGLLVLYLIDREYVIKDKDITALVQIVIVAVASVVGYFANFSYRWVGILVIVLMFYIRDYFKYFAPAFFVIYLVAYGFFNALFGCIALVFIYIYNGRLGTSSKKLKWFFYAFYPVHLVILGVIHRGMNFSLM